MVKTPTVEVVWAYRETKSLDGCTAPYVQRKALYLNTGRCNQSHNQSHYCGMGIVEDEVHVVFECPRYQNERTRFKKLFKDDMIRDHAILLNDTTDMMMRFSLRGIRRKWPLSSLAVCVPGHSTWRSSHKPSDVWFWGFFIMRRF